MDTLVSDSHMYINYMCLNSTVRSYFIYSDISYRNCTRFIRQRLTMVVLNGVIGFAVTLFFIAMKAPDLALTQLVVETITTILFIVSFSRLPNVPRNKPNMKKEIVKIVVSLITAMTVVSLIFITQQAEGMPTISKFYENADKLTGGKILLMLF